MGLGFSFVLQDRAGFVRQKRDEKSLGQLQQALVKEHDGYRESDFVVALRSSQEEIIVDPTYQFVDEEIYILQDPLQLRQQEELKQLMQQEETRKEEIKRWQDFLEKNREDFIVFITGAILFLHQNDPIQYSILSLGVKSYEFSDQKRRWKLERSFRKMMKQTFIHALESSTSSGNGESSGPSPGPLLFDAELEAQIYVEKFYQWCQRRRLEGKTVPSYLGLLPAEVFEIVKNLLR